jgi:ribosome-interacting GTPase 1
MAELGREEEQFSKINQELFSNGIRINQSPPKIQIRKTSSGGIKIHCSIQSLDSRTIQEVAKEFGIVNAEISIGEKVDLERLVDAFAKNRVWVPAIYVVNKAERSQAKEMEDVIFISAKEGLGLDKLQEEIWKKLKLVRVFLREEPVIMRENETLLDLAYKIGSDFAGSKKSAKIWGPSARFPGQTVPLSTKVQEGMKVEFV